MTHWVLVVYLYGAAAVVSMANEKACLKAGDHSAKLMSAPAACINQKTGEVVLWNQKGR